MSTYPVRFDYAANNFGRVGEGNFFVHLRVDKMSDVSLFVSPITIISKPIINLLRNSPAKAELCRLLRVHESERSTETYNH